PREERRHQKIGDFHNVYMNPESYQHYLATRTFPDKTVLVMDVYRAKERELQNILSAGFYPGEQRQVEVAVKNGKRPDGLPTDWGYYVFSDPSKPAPAKAFPDKDCYQCHLKHAAADNVWVQFYPTLRKYKSSETK